LLQKEYPNLYLFKQNRILLNRAMLIVCLFIFFQHNLLAANIAVTDGQKARPDIRMLMVYPSTAPVKISLVAIRVSESRRMKPVIDSAFILQPDSVPMPDSLIFHKSWSVPVFLKLKIKVDSSFVESRPFMYNADNPLWDVFVTDTSVVVKAKPASDDFETQTSMKGLALIIQAVFEMILAFLLVHFLGWPRIAVLMVLAGNLAAFPFYIIPFDSFIMRDLVAFAVKAVVMWLVGLRKLHFWKTLILVTVITFISYGFKTFIFMLVRIF
jgi:hypothetical protein